MLEIFVFNIILVKGGKGDDDMRACERDVFELNTLAWVGGDSYKSLWNIRDEIKGIISNDDMKHYKMKFSLVEYNDRYGEPILTKDLVLEEIEGRWYFVLNLKPKDTQDLNGKFVYQITLITPSKTQWSKQGIADIFKNINPTAFEDEIGG